MSEQQDILNRGRFEGEVITKLDDIAEKLTTLNAANIALETRVRVLEQWRAWVLGAGAVAGALTNVALRMVWK